MPMREVAIRTATASDRDAVLRLGVRALGWQGDERDRALFAWKHEKNPFGPSPSWVATIDDEVIGFRTLMRWDLGRGGEVLRMVRAVDTATDPDAQGQGVFKRLTLAAVESLTVEGYDAVFNTPNDQSRPGYLKMGWSQLGRPAVQVVPSGPRGLARMIRSHTPAALWSEPTTVGVPASDALGSMTAPNADDSPNRWATRRSLEYLRWRYSFEPLHYRAIEVKGGVCVFRVRRRGASLEVAICEWLSDEADPAAVHRLVRSAGDYGIGLGLRSRQHGSVPIPAQGPVVTWRPLARTSVPELSQLRFGLGDIELF